MLGGAGRLPADFTSLIGRVREVREVRAMLGRARLVSVTGPGGVGKTRIAVQAARTAERAFADGVWFVDLSGLRDPALVAATLATAIGEDSRSLSQLAERIKDWQALFLFDNCEHLIAACAEVFREILQLAPQVRILVTSRERMGTIGEHVLRVSPLDVPDDVAEPVTPAALSTCESVQLLVERAIAAWPEFTVTAANAADVARLCRRVEGLPLAIELAAARLTSMSVGQIADLLDDPYRILKTPGRSRPERQASLEDTIAWSYALCSADEQRLWARMSVFAGPVDATAVARVCSGPDLPVEDVPDLLDGLVGKSIVVCDQSEVPRFRMLGAIRHYGRRRLDETEAEELADRHLAYYERLVVDTAATWFGADQLAHANRLRSALPDLRVALDRILSGPEPDRGVVMVTGLSTLWVCLSRLQEGEIWLKRALGAVTDPPARAHFVLGWIQLSTGHRAAARASLARAVELAADSAEADVADQADVLLAVSEAFAGHFDAAVSGGQAALTRRRADGDDASVAVILMLLGEIYCGAARADDARRCAEESERISAAAGELWCRSYALWVRALVLCLRENYADAADVARESLRMKIALQDVAGILLVSEVLCWSMAADGRWADAAQLYAAIQPRGSSFPTSLRDFGYLDDQRAVWGARIVEGLGADKYHEIARSAVTLDTAAIGQLALGAGSAAPTPAAGDPSHGLLTKRESEVAELAAAGLTSRAIATRLFISTRTAEVHVERIMVKLGFTRRAQIAAWWHAESGTASRT